MDKIIGCKAAKDSGLKFYFTGKPCSRGHVAKRYVSGSACTACREEDKVKHLARKAELRKSNPNYRKQESKNRYAKHKTAILTYQKTNKDRFAPVRRKIQARYDSRNKDKCTAKSSRYRARKLLAVPSWADQKAIDAFYATAKGLEMLLGEWFHVDHIVPLQSDFVCGLHCEANLQVLPAKDNLTKSNRFWPDMWE